MKRSAGSEKEKSNVTITENNAIEDNTQEKNTRKENENNNGFREYEIWKLSKKFLQ